MGRRVSRKTKEEMTTVEVEVGGKKITLETGRLAKQANGAVLVRCGDTMVLVTATGRTVGREGQDFLPLTVDVEERHYAAGKIPGGVVPLLDVDREGEEILPLASYGAPCGGDEHHRVAAAHEYCSIGLLGQPAGLEGDLLAPDFHFYCSHLFLRLPTVPAPHCAQVLS